jgi:hypothetical protein
MMAEDQTTMDSIVEKREYLLLSSYCGEEVGCTDARPCPDCLSMCNVFKMPSPIDPVYVRQLGEIPNDRVKHAARDAIALIDEINKRAPSRKFNGIGQALHSKLCTIRATLVMGLA